MRRIRAVVVAVLLLAVTGPGVRADAVAAAPTAGPSFDDVAAYGTLTADHARIFRLYWAFFDRAPDPAGALYWVEQYERCAPLSSIVNWFAASDEFVQTYGAVDDAGFVGLLYRNVLDRDPDVDGLAYWLGLLARGQIDRSATVLHFSTSQEFSAGHPLPSDARPPVPCRLRRSSASTPRVVSLEAPVVFARTGGIDLVMPSVAVERIGFHESSHDGSQALVEQTVGVPTGVLPTRGRGTSPRSAADIVVHPMVPVLAPVSGTVLRAGGYTLYCDLRDDHVVIAPDAQPSWEVKVLHIVGATVSPGQRVEAGVTVLAPRARPLPLTSQVDRLTASPSWPHVHVEVVDPSVPDRPGTPC
jgi:Domain of unknown function (DUF4214)